jgi:energy-coupling factor transporter ATP-binding protein EcfA2
MKVASAHITNFKRFKSFSIDFKNSITEDVAQRFLLLGDNGAGKTTILQAVALALSLAAGQTKSVEGFDWFGWVAARYERWGTPRIELEVHFSEEEIRNVHAVARRWYDSLPNDRRSRSFIEPGQSPVVKLTLHGTRYETTRPEDIWLFRGRFYARELLRLDPSVRALFAGLPGVFWFDQFRNLASPHSLKDPDAAPSSGRLTVGARISELRNQLLRWKLIQGKKYSATDWYGQIERLFQAVFPGRAFGEPEPMSRSGEPAATDLFFMLSDGERTYDLEEASAGEQTVFPILFEFVVQQIANCVVIIDEVDLNLHPPAAQALLALLPTMGKGCQFLLSTHAEAVSEIFAPSQIMRLPGGKLCL